MQAIVAAKLPLRIAAVISNEANAEGLEFARVQGIATAVVDHRAHTTRDAFDQALMHCIESYAPDLVVLAGFMRILSSDFVQHYTGRLINIHPSLLPAFPGLGTHRRALEAGVKIHGCTVHFVTPVVDRGPIVAQAAVAVQSDDTAQSLAARVLQQEHVLYPQALRWFAEDRLHLAHDIVTIQGTHTPQLALSAPQELS